MSILTPTHSRFSLFAARLLVLAGALLSFATSAQTAAEITQLMQQGQHQQALQRAEKLIAEHPDNPHPLFLKGVILSEMGRAKEAIPLFTQLTQDYPELAEPYNNLAVIYAQQRQYDKAKYALEMALRANPGYATAHENMGDLHVRLAVIAYDKAIQLDAASATAQKKFSLARDLLTLQPASAKTLGK